MSTRLTFRGNYEGKKIPSKWLKGLQVPIGLEQFLKLFEGIFPERIGDVLFEFRFERLVLLVTNHTEFGQLDTFIFAARRMVGDTDETFCL